jgi:hypothetical protein
MLFASIHTDTLSILGRIHEATVGSHLIRMSYFGISEL